MPMPLKRITLRHLSGELLKLANLEKGFGYTVRQFVARPGHAARE